MEEQSLIYNQIRPQRIEDVYGSFLEPLRKDIKNNTIRQVYLFSGGSGQGKSASAMLLANYLPNPKVESVNIGEMSQVKDIRNLLKTAGTIPIGFQSKLLILNEVERASKAAESALLDFLEFPPKNVYIVMTTTDISKIKIDIQGRSKKIYFKPLPKHELKKVLDKGRSVCLCKTQIPDKIVDLIYMKSQGHARNALSELDTISDTDDEAEMIERLRVVKAEDSPKIINIFYAMYNGEPKGTVIKLINSVNQSNVEGLRKTFLKIAYNELNKTSDEEDHDYLYCLIKMLNQNGVWEDFMNLVEFVLEFYQVWKPKLERKYSKET